ncbi:MAG: shikimate kinase AroK [Nevskiales bacterium]
MSQQNIFLIGPMGAGKTTIGKRLAQLLGMRFVDSDHEVEHRTGVDIPYIFEKEGEAGFRRREAEVIDELTQQQDLVLATGGGVVVTPENRQHLAARGLVVYLHTTVDQQLDRTRKSNKRPLLQTANPRARLEALMAEREPLYREIADLVITTRGRYVRRLAQKVLREIEAYRQQA